MGGELSITSFSDINLGGEQRMDPQFALSAPAHFQWKGPGGIEYTGVGTTREISRNAVFVVCKSRDDCDCIPPIRTEVDLTLDMPLMEGGYRRTRLRGTGLVTRIEEKGGQPLGFAAELTLASDWKIEPVDWVQ
jgi:hypothetical protein